MSPRERGLLIGGVVMFAAVIAYSVGNSVDGPLAKFDAPSPTPVPTSVATFAPTDTPSPAPTISPAPVYDYQNSWPDAQLHVTQCVNTGRVGSDLVVKNGTVADVGGSITNTDPAAEDYIISFYANTNQGMGTGEVSVVRVQPGTTRSWSSTAVVTNTYPGKTLACGILNLNAAES